MNNIADIASTIFKSDPLESCSIQFILDNIDINSLFEILTLVLLEGIKIKYDNTDLSILDDLTETQIYDTFFFQFNEYFNSFGFNIKLNIKTEIPRVISSNKLVYNNEEYNFNMCTLFKEYYDDKTYCFYYNPLIESDSLKKLSLNILTKKYMLEIIFDFHYKNK